MATVLELQKDIRDLKEQIRVLQEFKESVEDAEVDYTHKGFTYFYDEDKKAYMFAEIYFNNITNRAMIESIKEISPDKAVTIYKINERVAYNIITKKDKV